MCWAAKCKTVLVMTQDKVTILRDPYGMENLLASSHPEVNR